jgi:hypothetical protein
MEVSRLGGVKAGVKLSGNDDGARFANGLDELDGAFAPDGEGQDSMGKQNSVAHRQNRNEAQRGSVLFGENFGGGARVLI